MRTKQRNLNTALIVLAALTAQTALSAPPVTVQGMPVPNLAQFDTLMQNFMDSNGIEAGLLGIMRNGVIVYQRGFGWKDSGSTIPLRHDDLMRIASLTKPITAAATQILIAGNFLNDSDFVFETGQVGGGLLNYPAFPAIGDPNLGNITILDVRTHRGGWDRNITSDPTYQEVAIASAMGINGVPGPFNTIRWIMGQPLDFAPGQQRQYSNVGFLMLGQIIEQVSGMTHLQYTRQNVFGPMDWMPVSEVVQGRTFAISRDPREPWYDSTTMVQNVFEPDGDNVPWPDGGWDHEARIGQGGYVVSTTALLHLAETYYISDRSVSDPTYGLPTGGVLSNRNHPGSMKGGTSAIVEQRTDGVNFVAIFNKNGTDVNSGLRYNRAIRTLIRTVLNNGGFTWPTQGVDGQWVDFANAKPGNGSYEGAWNDVQLAISNSPDEATLNFQAGTTDWTGTINQKIRLRAPAGGVVRIGQQ